MIFDSEESNHLARVLKKKSGAQINAFDEDGKSYLLELTDCADPAAVQAKIISASAPAANAFNANESGLLRRNFPLPRLILCPALIKLPRFEWLLEKSAELGVEAVQPIVTRRTIVHFSEQQIATKVERWKKILIAAAKQCDRANLPSVSAPILFPNLLKNLQNQKSLILWENEKINFLTGKKFETEFKTGEKIYLLTGPEGGFDPAEIEQARQANVAVFGLSTHILRAETASIAACSIILLR